MSGVHDSAVEAMSRLLAELPAEFSSEPPSREDWELTRNEFRVIKRSNVRTVHEALWELQQFLGMRDDD